MDERIAIGTAQFGQAYGVANRSGQVSLEGAKEILQHARASGLDTLDTAVAYGESEQRLGEIGVTQWKVISKLPALPEACADISGWVRETVLGSLARLKIGRLRGLLLHRPQQLTEGQGPSIYAALTALKEEGVVEKIGISIYSPRELDALWPSAALDLVQAPFNILDRRLATSGWLAKLHGAGTEIHVRSAFLQGLLLMDNGDRPAYFQRWQPLWDRWQQWLKRESRTPLQACLGFALARTEISRVVVGVDSLGQLREVLAATSGSGVEPPDLASEDADLVDPSRWDLQ